MRSMTKVRGRKVADLKSNTDPMLQTTNSRKKTLEKNFQIGHIRLSLSALSFTAFSHQNYFLPDVMVQLYRVLKKVQNWNIHIAVK